MTKVLQRVEASIRSFYIFNSEFGKKEGEEYKKILYYDPDDIELNTKIKDVGLSEAIIAFTGTFTTDDNCKALHTQKTTQLFYQPEPGFWMVLVVNVPKEIRSKDGVEFADYRGGEVHDRIYRAVLEKSYMMFSLLNGTFKMNMRSNSNNNEHEAREHLQQRLKSFFDNHLSSIKPLTCDIMDMTRSIQYLPLEKSLFLRAHNFISMVRATFSTIEEIMFLYNEQVVCSGKLEPMSLYTLHDYVVGNILAKSLQKDGNGASLVRSNSTASEVYRNGVFIMDPESDDPNQKPLKVYLKIEGALHLYDLIIFRALNATLCLLLKNNNDKLQDDFYSELRSFMGPQLTNIASDIEKTISKPASGKSTTSATAGTTATGGSDTVDASNPKYLFINEQSLKHLSNITVDRRRPKSTNSIPTNVMNLIADLETNGTSFEEVQVKTTNDFWIVKRNCNWRQYYVIIFNSKATLLDVTQESKRIFEKEITDDVFFDK